MKQLPESPNIPIVIVPYSRGDAYFTNAQKQRLEDLKARRGSLTPAEHEEWLDLVEAAFDATIARTKALDNAGL